jgi:hypothetical protein
MPYKLGDYPAHTDTACADKMESFARQTVKTVGYHFPSSAGFYAGFIQTYARFDHISSLKLSACGEIPLIRGFALSAGVIVLLAQILSPGRS